MSEKNLKVGFIGAGGMGREHIRAFKGLDGVELAGITSRTRAKAEALAAELEVPAVYDSIDELYTETKADIVVVAVPETEANAVLKAAFTHPWLILAEKPVGLDLEDALDIQNAARAADTTMLVGLNRRFLSSTRAAVKDLVDNQSARFIHVQDQQSFATAEALGYSQAIIDNWMYGNSIHLVDYFLIFGRGEVTKVTAVEPWDRANPGILLARIEFSSGDVGLYEALWHAPGPWACTVTTPERRWELRPLEKAVFQNGGERNLNEVALEQVDVDFKPGFRRQAEGVVAAARDKKHWVADLDEATRSMQLINAIYEAN